MGPEAPWLAPLAGYSDLPFRLLCREYGAAAACTEMVSAKGLQYKSKSTEELLGTNPEDRPLVVQLYGCDPDLAARAVRTCRRRGLVWFDLNAGCPVKKVVKTGCGAAMLRDAESRRTMREVVRAMVAEAGPGRVGVKFRLGWNAGDDVYLEVGRAMRDEGAGWVTLHPRSARQGFSGTARWSAVAGLVRAVDIPVLASGDLLTAEDGVRCLRETGAAGVMYARGAMSDPAIFSRHLALMRGEPQPEQGDGAALIGLMRRHMELNMAHGNPHTAVLKMRGTAPRYVKHIPGARALRGRLSSCTSWDEMEAMLEAFLLHDQAPAQQDIPEAQRA
jgi:tRNA-dihydrouridine synthase B